MKLKTLHCSSVPVTNVQFVVISAILFFLFLLFLLMIVAKLPDNIFSGKISNFFLTR